MFKQLKNNFTQAFTGTFIWVTLLITMFIKPQSMSLNFLWSLIGIALIMAFSFGVIYTYLWNYSTYKAIINVLLSSAINFLSCMLCLYLFSADMFYWVVQYSPYIAGLTLLGHFLGFYIYSKYDRKKSAEQLNKLLK